MRKTIIYVQYAGGGKVELAGPVDSLGQPFLPRKDEMIQLQLGMVVVTNLLWDFENAPLDIKLTIFVKPI